MRFCSFAADYWAGEVAERFGCCGCSAFRGASATAQEVDLRFLDIGGPGHLKTFLDAHVHWAGVFVMRKSAVGFGALAFRNFQFVAKVYGGDAEEIVIRFDAAFDFGFEMICSRDSARFQRAGKCAGQSTGEGGDDVIDCGGQRGRVLHPVVLGVAAMRAKVQWLRKSLDVSIAKRAFLLDQADFRGMNHFAHIHLSDFRMRLQSKGYNR
jgi:hypothetical protein